MTAVRRSSEGVKPWGRDKALTPADLRHVARLHGGEIIAELGQEFLSRGRVKVGPLR